MLPTPPCCSRTGVRLWKDVVAKATEALTRGGKSQARGATWRRGRKVWERAWMDYPFLSPATDSTADPQRPTLWALTLPLPQNQSLPGLPRLRLLSGCGAFRAGACAAESGVLVVIGSIPGVVKHMYGYILLP